MQASIRDSLVTLFVLTGSNRHYVHPSGNGTSEVRNLNEQRMRSGFEIVLLRWLRTPKLNRVNGSVPNWFRSGF
ncbi:hypothetical protein E2542_SST13605 [Spatholobus suberectus]|nr:hypothetical protein E2542_SST13605 [Spatholobus suberectus]